MENTIGIDVSKAKLDVYVLREEKETGRSIDVIIKTINIELQKAER